jgi:hypothetical protein
MKEDWGDYKTEDLNKPIYISIHNEGLFALHNLMCWFCREESAIFYLGPKWCFYPCRTCQAKFKGAWTEPKKKWWQKIL